MIVLEGEEIGCAVVLLLFLLLFLLMMVMMMNAGSEFSRRESCPFIFEAFILMRLRY